ncbi:DUF5958 family protein [Streptomyces lavendulocolor]|uniref:DUF5958 family protein n=1 Tax=Streptomyces lavendulocolor TaxID=67316 RepID=UPI003C2F45E4
MFNEVTRSDRRSTGRIPSLTPRHERRKAFRLLVAVLAITDARRRERYCSNGCSHGWHRLSAAD